MEMKHPFYHHGEHGCGCFSKETGPGEKHGDELYCNREHHHNTGDAERQSHGLKTVHGPDCT